MSGDNIKVAVRIRPLIKIEKSKHSKEQWGVQNATIYQIDEKGHRLGDSCFTFDHIFQGDKNNSEIYNSVVKQFVDAFLGGVNATIFAYGQTSSGKTHTMLGNDSDPGVMTQAIENIFDFINSKDDRKYLIRVSYLEIYNEKIGDLLQPTNVDLKILEDYSGGIILKNAQEEVVSTREQVYEYLKAGNNNRRIGATNMNEKSSRSHTIFKILLESTDVGDTENRNVKISSLNLVDLAGSERVAHTKATGIRMIEGGHINKSLTTLGMVIRRLSENQEFINFRDSKLTRLLQHSLGGNAKTLIIATVTPASIDFTQSTLLFAQTAKCVKNKPEINELLSDSEVIKRYESMNQEYKSRLDQLLDENKGLEQNNEEHSKVIARLREQIQLLEVFQGGINSQEQTPKAEREKRRHTIGAFSKRGLSLATITEDESINFTIGNETQDSICKILPAEELPYSPPKSVIKARLDELNRDYEDLVAFTRYEKKFVEEDQATCELQEKFEAACKQLADFKTRHLEEVDRLQNKYQNAVREISELKQQMTSEEEILRTQYVDKFKKRERELSQRIESLQLEARQPNFGIGEIAEDLYSLQDLLINIPDQTDNNPIQKCDKCSKNTDSVTQQSQTDDDIQNDRQTDQVLEEKPVDDLSNKLSELTRENAKLTRAISEMQEKLAAADEAHSKSSQDRVYEITELRLEKEHLLNTVARQVESLEIENDSLINEMRQSQERHAKENDAYVRKIEELDSERVELLEKIVELEVENDARCKQLDELKSDCLEELAGLKSEQSELHDRYVRLQEDYTRKEFEVRGFAVALESIKLDLKRADADVQKIPGLETENEIFKVRVSDLEKREQKYLEEIANLSTELEVLTEEHSKLRDLYGDKKHYLADCLTQIHQLNEKNSNLVNENRTLHESLRGEVQKAVDLYRIISSMEKEKQETPRKDENSNLEEIEMLSSRISELEDENAKKDAQLTDCLARIDQLNRERENASLLEETPQKDENSNLEEIEMLSSRISELEEYSAKKDAQLTDCLALIDQLNRERENASLLEETNLSLQNEVRALNVRISDLQQLMARKSESSRGELQEQRDDLSRVIRSLQTKIADVQKENDILNKRLLDEKQAKCNLVDSLQKQIANLQTEKDLPSSGKPQTEDQLKSRVRDLTVQLTNSLLKCDTLQARVVTTGNTLDQERRNHARVAKELEENAEKSRADLKTARDVWTAMLDAIIKEQKTVHTMKVPQEQRPYLKDVRKDLRESNLEIKIHNAAIIKGDLSKLADLPDAVVRAWNIMKRYFDCIRAYQDDQMGRLDRTVQEHLQEITKLHTEKQDHVLKDRSGNIENLGTTDCVKCQQLREDLGRVQKELQKEIGIKVDLTMQYYKLQDEHKSCTTQIEESKNVCRFLEVQLDRIKKKTETSQTSVQCELLTEADIANLRDKYETIKKVAVIRRDQIEKLEKILAEKN